MSDRTRSNDRIVMAHLRNARARDIETAERRVAETPGVGTYYQRRLDTIQALTYVALTRQDLAIAARDHLTPGQVASSVNRLLREERITKVRGLERGRGETFTTTRLFARGEEAKREERREALIERHGSINNARATASVLADSAATTIKLIVNAARLSDDITVAEEVIICLERIQERLGRTEKRVTWNRS